jgi:hypothetical protein
MDDLFIQGYVDVGILNSTYLYEFYKNGSLNLSGFVAA